MTMIDTAPAVATAYRPLYRSELTAGGATSGRAPLVTWDEFQRHAARGEQVIRRAETAAAPPAALLDAATWHAIRLDAFHATRAPWGGMTTNARTGDDLAPDADAYALTVRAPGEAPVSVPASAGFGAFCRAMNRARRTYARSLSRSGAYLGVFHDAESGMVDIDPVHVAYSLSEANDVGAFTRAPGGAYHFATGDGYWAPSVADGERR